MESIIYNPQLIIGNYVYEQRQWLSDSQTVGSIQFRLTQPNQRCPFSSVQNRRHPQQVYLPRPQKIRLKR